MSKVSHAEVTTYADDLSIDDLAARYVSNRDEILAERLFTKIKPTIVAIARDMRDNFPSGTVWIDDLIEAGIAGFAKGLERLDVSKTENYATYLRRRIQGEMKDSLRQLDTIDHRARAALNKAREFEAAYQSKHPGAQPQKDDYRAHWKSRGASKTELQNLERYLRGEITPSQIESIHPLMWREDDDIEYDASKRSPEPFVEPDFTSLYSNELYYLLKMDIADLPERHQFVVESCLTQGRTTQEIADQMNITSPRVSQMVGVLRDDERYFPRTKAYINDLGGIGGLNGTDNLHGLFYAESRSFQPTMIHS